MLAVRLYSSVGVTRTFLYNLLRLTLGLGSWLERQSFRSGHGSRIRRAVSGCLLSSGPPETLLVVVLASRASAGYHVARCAAKRVV